MKLTGIQRASRFSPNSESRDAAIFNSVTDSLTDMGHNVTVISEDNLDSSCLNNADLIFSMGRSKNTLSLLEKAVNDGITVLNHPTSLLHLNRKRWKSLCHDLNIGVSDDMEQNFSFPCWIKRDDECAQKETDICFVSSQHELNSIIGNFNKNNINNFIIEKHIEGDLIKFYGVAGTDFFYYSYPNADNNKFSKFGLEEHNNKFNGYNFDTEKLKHDSHRLASRLGIPIFGGDAIISPQGNTFIIDFNDWPSFSACREEASKAIVRLITDSFK